MRKKINNYEEYKNILKVFFNGINKMPSNEEIQSFIDIYNLFKDWQIIITDVKNDISSVIIKNRSDKSKFISSYKQYLVQLKKSFGIPNEVPSKKQIEEFIEEYNLEKDWGIVEEDVSKDLEELIDGKYDNKLKGSAYAQDIQVNKTIIKSSVNTYSTSTNRATPKTTFQPNPLSNINYEYQYRRTCYSPSVSEKSINRVKKEKIKNTINKTKEHKTQKEITILIDGDNNIKKGQEGIENTPENIKVMGFFSQEGAKRKFDRKFQNRPNVSSKLVLPGDQAVDNQIKAEAGQILKKGNQVTIVSHDKDFEKFKKRKQGSFGRRITLAKSVKDTLKK